MHGSARVSRLLAGPTGLFHGLAFAALVACGEANEREAVAPTGDASADAPSGPAPAPSANGDASDADPCTDLGFGSAPVVTITDIGDAGADGGQLAFTELAPLTGGPLVDGTYELVEWTPFSARSVRREVVRFTGDLMEQIYDNGSADHPNVQRAVFRFTLDGTAMKRRMVCMDPVVRGAIPLPYRYEARGDALFLESTLFGDQFRARYVRR